MRYPPFDRDRTNPTKLDIMECVVRSKSNLINSIEIGDVSSWMPIGDHLKKNTMGL